MPASEDAVPLDPRSDMLPSLKPIVRVFHSKINIVLSRIYVCFDFAVIEKTVDRRESSFQDPPSLRARWHWCQDSPFLQESDQIANHLRRSPRPIMDRDMLTPPPPGHQDALGVVEMLRDMNLDLREQLEQEVASRADLQDAYDALTAECNELRIQLENEQIARAALQTAMERDRELFSEVARSQIDGLQDAQGALTRERAESEAQRVRVVADFARKMDAELDEVASRLRRASDSGRVELCQDQLDALSKGYLDAEKSYRREIARLRANLDAAIRGFSSAPCPECQRSRAKAERWRQKYLELKARVLLERRQGVKGGILPDTG